MKRRSPVVWLLLAVSALFLTAQAASAQSGDVVISANTTWPEGTYGLNSLTVNNGATLTIGGGSSVNVAGTVLVSGSSKIVLQGKNNTGQVSGQWAGVGVTVQAGTLQVDAGSQISADGQGYTTFLGPGGSASYGIGGSYGGRGSGDGAAAPYGSYLQPTDLGSAGGASSGYSAGGGAIRLIVSGTLTNNGTVTANGMSANGNNAGASGGSIYVTTGAIAGSGTFTANGNQGSNASGGGGRIAIYYATNSESEPPNAAAAPGPYWQPFATVGSVYLLENNANLYVTTNLTLPADTSASYSNVTVWSGGLLTLGGGSTLAISNTLSVTGNSTILLQGKNNTGLAGGEWKGVGATINAGNIQVDFGGTITADGQGYTTGQGPGGSSSYSIGGSYGGRGSGASAATYGLYLTPTDLGSAGGASSGYSAGGGAIRLNVSGTLTNDGTITANGMSAGGNNAGASGGSIYVTTGTIAGGGTITANGNQGSNSSGGGGRVAIYYITNAGFNPAFVTASGGLYWQPFATAGTVYLLENTANLYVTTNLYLPPDTNASYVNMVVSDGATLTLGGGSSITVSGTTLVTGNSTILVQSKNNTQQVDGSWQGTGGTISAGNLQIDSGSRITADGQGYSTALGPGGSSSYSIGASYGGRGSGSSAPIYGSYLAPADLGSAGNASSGYSLGGGAIRLIVSGTLMNNGTVSANGVSANGNNAGASGGSIYVTTGTIAGSGAFTANGNQGNNSSGGGGRVAIYYASNGGFDPALATAMPGLYWQPFAEAGSVLFIDSTSNSVTLPGGQTVVATDSTFAFNNVTLNNAARLLLGGGSTLNAGGSLSVTAGTVISLLSKNNTAQVDGQWVGQGATIVAGNVQVAAGAAINADGQGYSTANGPGGSVSYGIGGSYGGRGSGASAPTYGSASAPTDLGSAGGASGGWSLGGGAIRMIVAGTLTNNGTISANGISSGGNNAGASGGSIYVTTSEIGGSGLFAANGNQGSNASGGGGRIAIYYATNAGFDPTRATAVQGLYWPGATAGTVVFTSLPVDITVTTEPGGLTFTADGETYTGSHTFSWVVGSSHTIATTSPQAGAAGTRYVFANWSDGGGQSHGITVSASTPSYTASFNTQYQLATAVAPADAGTVSPASGAFYTSGAIVDLVATPGAGYSFSHWTGPVADSNGASTTVTMTGSTSVTANFTSSSVQVTVDTSPAGRTFTVDGTAYASAHTFSWTAGSAHTIATTTPQGTGATRYVFASWSDGGAISHTVSPSTATTYTASFTTQYQLTTTASPLAGGSIAAQPTSNDGFYNSGTAVQLTATASAGYTFSGWSGDLSGTTNPQSVTMSAPHSVTANFAAPASVTVNTNPAGRTFTVDGTSYTSAQTFSWTAGSTHTIATTTPQGTGSTRYVFASWSDGGPMSHTVTPSAATTYTASFTTHHQLTTTASPLTGGSVAAQPTSTDGFYNSGTAVQLTATASAGYTFAGWSGDLSGTANPQSVAMTSPRHVTANFSPTAPADFQLGVDPRRGSTSDTVKAGGTGMYRLTVTGLNDFAGAVALACTATPELPSCSVTPTQVAIGGTSSVPFTVRVATIAPTKGKNPGPGTPSGDYAILVTATSGTTVRTLPLTLTVK